MGVVTGVELDLLDIPSLYAGTLFYTAENIARVLRTWAGWSAQLPDEANTSVALMNLPYAPSVPEPLAGRTSLAVRFAAVAKPESAEQLLAPIRAVDTPAMGDMATLPYPDLLAMFSEPTDPMPVHQRHCILDDFPDAAVTAVLEAAGPGSGSGITTVEIRRLAGAFARTPTHASAFSHRRAGYAVTALGILIPEPDRIRADVNQLMTALTPWTSPAVLRNFLDTNDLTEVRRAYSAETLDRLHALAATYDPRGVFAVNGEATAR